MENDDPTRVIMDHSYMPIGFKVGNNLPYPWVKPYNGKFESQVIDSMVQDASQALIVDKYAMKFVGGAMAANAALMGRSKVGGRDTLLTLHDATKAAKFLNRPTQARKHLHAHVEGRTKSSFGTLLPNGEVVRQSGIRLKTRLTNSRLCAGSAPAFRRQDLSIDVSVRKSLHARFNLNRIPKQYRDQLTLDEAKDMLELKAAALVGKVFEPYEPMITLLGGTVVVFKNKNSQPIKVTGVRKVSRRGQGNKEYKGEAFSISLEVDLL
jgi:hypothetical protein